MIPQEELEDGNSYLIDLIFFVVVSLISWFSVTMFLEGLEREVKQTQAETMEINKKKKRLSPDLNQFDEMNERIESLNLKLYSLRKISTSKVTRHKQVIVLEHLQNIKPEGIWFTSLQDDTKNSTIKLTGGSFDNLLVAEFMSSLNSTKHQESDKSDLRSQIYFEPVHLGRVSKSESSPSTNEFLDPRTLNQGQQSRSNATNIKSQSLDSNNIFPELSKFPVFELAIQYSEREDQYMSSDMIEPPKQMSKEQLNSQYIK